MLLKLRKLSQMTVTTPAWALALAFVMAAGFTGCAKPSESTSITQDTDSSLIIGGVLADGSEDFASTIVGVRDLVQQGLCTGSIVGPNLVLTAAHCIAESPAFMEVVFGTDVDSDKAIRRRVLATRVSPIYAFRSVTARSTGDIAILRFEGSLPAGYRPARVLADAEALLDGQAILLAGYGQSNRSKENDGAGVLRSVETNILKAAYTNSEILVDQSKGKGACHGDSGGPAYIMINNTRVLVGVTSRTFNDPTDSCAVGSVYTSIAYHLDWLKPMVKELMALKFEAAPVDDVVPVVPAQPSGASSVVAVGN